MTRKEKLLAALKANGSGFTHRDATALLTYLGYTAKSKVTAAG